MNMTNGINLPLSVLEEIALEGLEGINIKLLILPKYLKKINYFYHVLTGITIEGLFKRIGSRLKIALPLNTQLKTQVWNFIINSKCIQFYELPIEREPLKVFDRANYNDPFFTTGEASAVSLII